MSDPHVEMIKQRPATGAATYLSSTNRKRPILARILLRAALLVFETDPHLWNSRPSCETCRVISHFLEQPYGCSKAVADKDIGEQ